MYNELEHSVTVTKVIVTSKPNLLAEHKPSYYFDICLIASVKFHNIGNKVYANSIHGFTKMGITHRLCYFMKFLLVTRSCTFHTVLSMLRLKTIAQLDPFN